MIEVKTIEKTTNPINAPDQIKTGFEANTEIKHILKPIVSYVGFSVYLQFEFSSHLFIFSAFVFALKKNALDKENIKCPTTRFWNFRIDFCYINYTTSESELTLKNNRGKDC